MNILKRLCAFCVVFMLLINVSVNGSFIAHEVVDEGQTQVTITDVEENTSSQIEDTKSQVQSDEETTPTEDTSSEDTSSEDTSSEDTSSKVEGTNSKAEDNASSQSQSDSTSTDKAEDTSSEVEDTSSKVDDNTSSQTDEEDKDDTSSKVDDNTSSQTDEEDKEDTSSKVDDNTSSQTDEEDKDDTSSKVEDNTSSQTDEEDKDDTSSQADKYEDEAPTPTAPNKVPAQPNKAPADTQEGATTPSTDGSYGNFELIIPTTEVDGVVGSTTAGDPIQTTLYLKVDNGNITIPLNYRVVVYDENKIPVTDEVMEFTIAYYIAGVTGVTFPVHHIKLDVPPGHTVEIKDIALIGEHYVNEWNIHKWTSVKAGAVLDTMVDKDGNNMKDEINPAQGSENPVELSKNQTKTLKFMKVKPDLSDQYYQTPSEETFLTTGNHYATGLPDYPYLDKLLNSINAFSFKDIEGQHIVGPIIAQNEAYRKRDTPITSVKSNGYLAFADYARGTPSYIGNLTANLIGESSSLANYGYDDDYPDFKAPLFYTSTSTKLLDKSGVENVVVPGETVGDDIIFISPNNWGQTPTHHNDKYVDFDKFQDMVLAESIKLLEDGSIENFDMSKTTIEYDSRIHGSVLEAYPGHCYNIVNADNLTTINLNIPEGVDYFTSSSPDPLTINFLCDTINPKVIGGEKTSQFPVVTMNGEQFANPGLGEGVEFNEFGNKLIYNMPYVKTVGKENRVVTLANGQNIPGHFVMPQAEFWNYEENFDGVLKWEGGNLNGCMIAKDIHFGELEAHMWAYGGKAPKFGEYGLEALKRVNSGIPNEEFTFELNPHKDNDLLGVDTKTFPLIATSNSLGEIHFQRIRFTRAGTYKFVVNEVIPKDTGKMEYDQSEYEVTVTVKEVIANTGDETFETSATVKRVKDSAGNVLSKPENVEDIVVFNNKTSTPIFPSTGGVGVVGFTVVGLSFMVVAIALSKKKQSKSQS